MCQAWSALVCACLLNTIRTLFKKGQHSASSHRSLPSHIPYNFNHLTPCVLSLWQKSYPQKGIHSLTYICVILLLFSLALHMLLCFHYVWVYEAIFGLLVWKVSSARAAQPSIKPLQECKCRDLHSFISMDHLDVSGYGLLRGTSCLESLL